MYGPAFAPRCVIRLLTILCFLTLAALLRAQPVAAGGTDLSALTTSFDYATNEAIFTGEARFADGQTLIQAEEIRFHSARGVIVATGRVRFTRGDQRVLADRITYRRSDQYFELMAPRLGSFPFYVSGTTASGTPDRITVNNATASVREPGPFQPTLRAESLTYTSEPQISTTNARLGVGAFHPITLPKFSHRLNLPFISYVSLSAGYRPSLGLFAEGGVHLPFSQETRLGAALGLYAERGVMFGPSAHYEIEHDGQSIHGDLRSGFISDSGDRKTDVLGQPVPKERGYVQWWHTQDLTDRLRLAGQVHYWKDSEILRDFRPREFFPLQEPDTFIEATHTGDNFFASVFTRLQPNTYHRVQERLPEVRFDLLSQTILPGVYQRFSGSFAALREKPPGGGPGLRSNRFDAYYALNGSLNPHEWFSFIPVVGGRVTHYTRPLGKHDYYTRTLGEFGLDAELRGSATFEYKNEVWKIDGLRHLVTPRLTYRYVPDAERGRAFIPAIDRRTFATYLSPLGLGDIRHIDDLGPLHTLRLGLDNILQTRDSTYGSRDLVVFNVAADLRFDRTPGDKAWSAIHTALTLTPAPWLEFELYQNFTPYNLTLQEFNTSLTLRDGDAWALSFSSHFLRREIEEFIVSPRYRFNEAFEAVGRLHYDARQRRMNEQAIGVRHNLHNSWIIEYLVTQYDGPRRESNFGFSIRIESLGF
jgi:LPS-assembly protein